MTATAIGYVAYKTSFQTGKLNCLIQSGIYKCSFQHVYCSSPFGFWPPTK